MDVRPEDLERSTRPARRGEGSARTLEKQSVIAGAVRAGHAQRRPVGRAWDGPVFDRRPAPPYVQAETLVYIHSTIN